MIGALGYILAVAALVLACWLVDALLLERWAAPILRKWLIVSAVSLSFVLPFCWDMPVQERQRFDEEAYSGWQVVDISDAQLRACYAVAANSQEVCRCEVEQKARLIIYEPNDYYEWLLPTVPYLVALWLLGALALLVRLAGRLFAASRWLAKQPKEPMPSGAWWRVRTTKVAAAAAWSWANRWYVLWGAGMDKLNEQEQKAVCRHEWAHLTQRDTWLNLYWQCAQAFLWWLPAFYALRRRWALCCELVADARAVEQADASERKAYAQMLFRLQTQAPSPQPSPLAAPLLGQKKRRPSLLAQRIRAILQPQAAPRWTRSLLATLVACACLYAAHSQISPRLQAQGRFLQAYEAMRQTHQHTGTQLFCPDCVQPPQ